MILPLEDLEKNEELLLLCSSFLSLSLSLSFCSKGGIKTEPLSAPRPLNGRIFESQRSEINSLINS